MKITYNKTGTERKELVNAISQLLHLEPVYMRAPTYAYSIGEYVVDKNGTLFTPDEGSEDEVFQLVDALIAEYGYKPEESLSELFPEEEEESFQDDDAPQDEIAESAQSVPETEEDGAGDEAEAVEEAEAMEEEESTEEPQTTEEAETAEEAPESPENVPETAEVEPSKEDAVTAETPEEAPNQATGEGEEAVAEDTESTADFSEEDPENASGEADSGETEADDDTHLTLSMPRSKFSDAALERLKALVMSKQTILKKVFETDDLSIIVDDEQVMFPWFTLHDVDGEVDAYSRFILAIAKRAITSSRISSQEKPSDNEKFTMRLFLNSLGFQGDEYKFARRFLIRNLEGNGAWRYGNGPGDTAVELELPTVVKPGEH